MAYATLTIDQFSRNTVQLVQEYMDEVEYAGGFSSFDNADDLAYDIVLYWNHLEKEYAIDPVFLTDIVRRLN